MTYRIGRRTYQGFTQTTQTREQVLKSILKADEIFKGGTSGTIDLLMDMYYEETDTIGYTYVSDPYFHMNRYLQADYSPAQTSGNIFHEWLHKLGFKHSQEYNKYRPHSVPYKLGYLMAQLSAKLAGGTDPMLRSMFEEDFTEMLERPCSHH